MVASSSGGFSTRGYADKRGSLHRDLVQRFARSPFLKTWSAGDEVSSTHAKTSEAINFFWARSTKPITFSWLNWTGPKDRCKSVVVILLNGIKFVSGISHTSLSDQGTQRRGVHEILKPFILILVRIVGFIVPRAESKEAGGD